MKTQITLTITHARPIDDLVEKVVARAYTLDGVDNAEAVVVASPVQPSQEDADHQAFIDALSDPEDKMFQQIDAWARKSYRHHKSSIRGQQITASDSFDSHLVWAALRWAKENVQPSQAVDVLHGLIERVQEMREASYTFGEYSKEAVNIALDGVIDFIDAAINAKGAV